jgi:hypothetical protein
MCSISQEKVILQVTACKSCSSIAKADLKYLEYIPAETGKTWNTPTKTWKYFSISGKYLANI